MDEWVSEDLCTLRDSTPVGPEMGSRKRKRGRWPGASSSSNREASSSMNGFSLQNSFASTSAVDGERRENGLEHIQGSMTEEELDASQHKQLTAQRNFDTVIFDEWKIRPWYVKFLLLLRVDGIPFHRYYSPYPLTEGEEELSASASVNQSFHKVPGVSRVTARAHGRTSDLLTGGLLRQYGTESTLWVCHFCFKYMVDGVPWELHKVSFPVPSSFHFC